MIEPAYDTPELDVPARATGVVVVDLQQIRANWRSLSERVAPAECAAVVKADAYGLGAAHVIPALSAEGCRTFFVATSEEAADARRLAPGAIIYVLDGLLDAAWLASIDARPVLADIGEVLAWSRYCLNKGWRLPAALQLESGLNRRGMDEAAIARLIATPDVLGALELGLVMSHLACADDPDHPMNRAQRERFEASRARLPAAAASLAASDGLMLGRDYHFDLVRPGYAIYGGQAFRGGRAPVEPVMQAYARVLQVRDVPQGEPVGYAATWSSPGGRRIATIAAGYADGVFRHASGSGGKPGGMVAIGGRLCPIVGRVSMDLVTADVTDVPAAADMAWAELIGPHLTLEEVGAHAGSIGYEVLTRLGRRFHRIYMAGD